MTDPNDDLQRLFADATSDVRPRGTFEDIQTRITKEHPMARRWFLPVAAAAAVVALTIGGITWAQTEDTPPTVAPAAPGRAAPVDVTVWYAGETTQGHGLFPEVHQVPAMGDTGVGDLEDAVQLAISGDPDDPDYRTLWPAGTTVRDVAFGELGEQGTITVSLNGPATARPAGMSDRDAMLAIISVVRTAQSVTRTASDVEFYHDGELLPEVLGTPGDAFAAGDDATYLAPVQIDVPTDGAVTNGEVLKVRGRAATFEANVLWELKDGDRVVQDGFTTALEGGVLSEYAFTIENIAPGRYTLVVHDSDESGENRPTNQDTKDIVVE